MPSAKKVIARNTIANTLIMIWSKGMAFFLFPFIVHRVSVEGYGVWLMVGAVTGYFGLFDFGVTTSLTKYIAQYNAKDDKEMVNKMVNSTFMFHLLVGIAIASGLVVMGIFFDRIFIMDPELHPLARYIFFITAAAALTSWPSHSFAAILPGLQRYDIQAGLRFVSTSVKYGATIAVLLLGYGLVELVFVQILVATVMPLATVFVVQKLLPYLAIRRRYMDLGTLKTIFRFSSVVFLGQISYLVVNSTDTIILGAFVGVGSIVFYSVARKLEEFAHFASGLPASALLPAATELDALGKKKALERLIFRGGKYKCAIVLSFTVVIFMLAETIIIHWMGAEYAHMAFATRVYVSYWFIYAAWGVTTSVLLSVEKFRPVIVVLLGTAGFNLVLSIILVQYYGIIGVILGTVLPYFMILPFLIPCSIRLLDIRLRDFAKKVWLRTYPVAALTALAIWAIMYLYTPDSIIEVGLLVLFSMSIFWGLFYFAGLERFEKEQIRRYIHTFLPSRTGT